MVVVALCTLCWGGLGLTLTPAVNHDEVVLNIAAREWQLHGTPTLPPLADFDPSYARSYYFQPPGHLATMRLAYAVFGFSIQTTRGVSLVYAALLAAALFALARQLTGRPDAAFGTVALFFAHQLSWWLPRSGRMDSAALLFGVLGALVWLRKDASDRWKSALLAGALVGCGSLFHVLAAFFVPAMIAAEAARSRRLPGMPALLLAGTAAVPLLAWVAMVFARGDGHDWMVEFVGYQLQQRHSHISPWQAPFAELALLGSQVHPELTPFVFPTLVLALVAAWKRLTRPARAWAFGGLTFAFLTIALLMEKGTGVYPLYWYIWLSLLAGAGIPTVLNQGPGWRRAFCWLGVLTPFLWQGALTGIALYQHSGRDPERSRQFFASHVLPGTVVLGPEDIWYGVDAAGATLRIWSQPDPALHDYYVSYAGNEMKPPVGFHLVATLPDVMPKVFGHYFSHSVNAYDLWISSVRHPTAKLDAKRTANPGS